MNKEQANEITRLISRVGSIRDEAIEDLTKEFDAAMNKIVETSNNPKKDGEENFRKLDDMKEEYKRELKEVFEKFAKKLNSL